LPDGALEDMALVSVIIPTTRRPELVGRALRSVFAQTHEELEVIVVVDGPNPETMTVLSRIADPRLRVLQNEVPLGPGAARNAGAELAKGEWLAFLDDDDEWLPRKLERQLGVASPDEPVLITCRCRVVTPQATYIWPRQVYDGVRPVDDYLWARQSLFRGEAYLATATYMISRRFFMLTRFGTTRHNEDDTLLLRLVKRDGGRIHMVPEVLAVIHADEPGNSLGANFPWREALAWLDGMSPLVSPRAYSGFCLVILASQAKRIGDYRGFGLLLRRSFSHGAPTAIQLLLFFTFWIVPMRLRQRLRAVVQAHRVRHLGLAPIGQAGGRHADTK
jgi:glycosyltransferase involved in cell wall biosynthesis